MISIDYKYHALRGAALTYTDDPFRVGAHLSMRYDSDAIVCMSEGKITHFGPARRVLFQLPADTLVERTGKDTLMLAGFIDCHAHYPQTECIGDCGEQLTDWLNGYTFLAEQKFASKAHAREVAKVFLRECLRAGTTTACVCCTVHPQAVDAFFEEANALDMRMIAGKILMDRHAPQALTDTPRRGYDDSKSLILRWHDRGRQLYCVTPKFSLTSTPAQMEMAGLLWAEHPGTYLQSHVAENRAEAGWVKDFYPQRHGCLDVHDYYKQLGPRSIYAHGVWLSEAELRRCHETGAAIAHCPSANAFLGSGVFNLKSALTSERPVRVGLATDIGAGASFSMLRTLKRTYEAAKLNGYDLSAALAFYLATRGGARALYLEDKIGSIAVGHEADVIVLDLKSTPVIEYRMRECEDLEEALFVQMALADERAILATYVAGKLAYRRESRHIETRQDQSYE
ncbi:MAG TPA: guanine deaminase [Steroidobacter sp.]|uniref:guanine deaminase n=1 Tax=Steroidobacter sp. TaxID=1978227 RepID=UPI002EDAE439